MKQYRIRLETANNAALFVTICNEFGCDIDAECGRYVLDAKSIMGVLSVGLDRELLITLHTDNLSVADEFEEAIKLWEVK